jgi:broad specificity phosphatase PhoE
MPEPGAPEQSSETILYLVRHGETEWNAAGRYQGAKDSPLTARGREQARLTGRKLAAMHSSARPSVAYVSPLGRARETAALICESLPLDIRLEPPLAEVSAGEWDGLSMYEIDVEYPGALSAGDRHDWYFLGPGGETFEAAFARVADWLGTAAAPAIIVTHGLTSRLIRGAYTGSARSDMLQLPVPQAGFYRLAGGAVNFIGVD